MSPAHVLEPTYQAIKKRLMEGAWPGGYRLDTARLADELGVSKSPVRDSLNHLAGERMVEFEVGAGFHVPRFDEKRLRDLFDLNLHLVLVAIQVDGAAPPLPPSGGDLPTRTGLLFLERARASGNDELTAVIASLNDRLAAVRTLEPVVLSEPAAEVDRLAQAMDGGAPIGVIRDLLTRYHVTRKTSASQFTRLLSAGNR